MLKYAISQGIIDVSSIQEKLNMKEKEEILNKHPYSIWQGKNGYWYTRLDYDEKGKVLKKRKTKDDIEKLIVSYYKEKENEPSVNDLFTLWINEKYRLGEISKSCYDRYICDFNRFMKDSIFGNKKIKFVEELDIEYFIRESISKFSLTSKAYSGLRTILKGAFRYAKQHGYTKISISNFFGDLQLSKTVFKRNVKAKETQVYTEEETILITDFLKQHTNIENLGILLAFQTGIRVGELAALKPCDIKGRGLNIRRTEITFKDENEKQVHEVKDFPKSDAGFRTIIMSKEALNTIENIFMIRDINDEYLFSKRGKRILSKNYGWHLRGVCKELGIPFRSMHKIRKTYGTTLIDNDVDDSTVVEQMGHSDIKCTKQYYYFSNKSTAKKIEQIDKAISW